MDSKHQHPLAVLKISTKLANCTFLQRKKPVVMQAKSITRFVCHDVLLPGSCQSISYVFSETLKLLLLKLACSPSPLLLCFVAVTLP
jgi:hypothetical protein